MGMVYYMVVSAVKSNSSHRLVDSEGVSCQCTLQPEGAPCQCALQTEGAPCQCALQTEDVSLMSLASGMVYNRTSFVSGMLQP